MFADTETTEMLNTRTRSSVDEPQGGANLRIYIGAAAGVGKTYQMLEDANAIKRQGIDVVIGAVETHGRAETAELVGDLEIIPPQKIEYKGNSFSEMDVDAIIRRKPAIAIVDELAHTNVIGSRNDKRYKDVEELLENGISVISAINVQHLESLNDVVTRATGIVVRETIPDCFLSRADEIIDVDVSVDTLRTRLRQGKIYSVEKIEQALNNFFRKGNLSTLRELALRQVAMHQSIQDHEYREQQGIEQAPVPERVMVCMASRGRAAKLLRTGARIVGRLAVRDWFAVYVETPDEEPGRISPEAYSVLRENISLAERLGAQVIKLHGKNVADELLKFAKDNEITHVIFGQSARSRWEIIWKGSVINRFLKEVKDASVHVIPLDENPRLTR